MLSCANQGWLVAARVLFCACTKDINDKFEEHRTVAAMPGGRVSKEGFDATVYQQQETHFGLYWRVLLVV